MFREAAVEMQSEFYRGVFIGLGSAAVASCLIAYGLHSQLFLIHEPLIGSALTIVAGFLPVWVIYKQIVVTVTLAKTERESRLVRTRALLSMPLLDLSDYASTCSAMLLSHYPRSGDIVHRLQIQPVLPNIPRDAINIIAETCGFCLRKGSCECNDAANY